MRSVLVMSLLLVLLPAMSVNAQTDCDGNFHEVHRIEMDGGALIDVDFSMLGDGWAVGSEFTDGKPDIRPVVVRFDADNADRDTTIPAFKHRAQLGSVDALTPNDVWAVGVETIRKVPHGVAMHWDGATWTVADTPSPGKGAQLRRVIAFAPNDVWALGDWGTKGDKPQLNPLLIHFDGVSWTRVRDRVLAGSIYLVALGGSSSADLWLGGYTSKSRPLAVHWDGSQWSRAHFGLGKLPHRIVSGLSAPNSSDVWLAGTNFKSRHRVGPFALHFDGSKWSDLSPGGSNLELLNDVAANNGQAWTGGFVLNSEEVRANARMFNGSDWSSPSVEGTAGTIPALTYDTAGAVWAIALVSLDNGTDESVLERACTS